MVASVSGSASVGFGTTQGLKDDGSTESAGFKALKGSAGKAASPNLKGSAEAMLLAILWRNSTSALFPSSFLEMSVVTVQG